MAKPIKNTPVLKGKDLVAFYEELAKSEQTTPMERKKERERIAENAKRLAQSLVSSF